MTWVVKTKEERRHARDLQSVFDILKQHKLRLNAMCAFRMGSGKFFRYMITTQGIEVNLDQIIAIQQLRSPGNPKEIQKLTSMIAMLRRFVSRSTDRCRPLCQLLKKWKGFRWT